MTERNGRALRPMQRVIDETIFIHFSCHRNRGRDRQPNRFGIASMKRIIVIAFLFATSQAWAAFGYYSPISINSAQVPSTQTDFPVLVSVTDARFKDVAHSGHVQSSSGFDIRPYTNSGLGTAITGYELERYNASTGEVVMWVKVSSLSSSTTPFVLAYGDSGITTDGSSTTTWSNSFLGVYHLKDGTTLSVSDSTGSNNGTNHSGTATSGQIDGAISLAGGGSNVDLGTAMNPTAVTYSVWINAATFPNSYNNTIVRINAGATVYSRLLIKSTGKLACYVIASAAVFYDGSGSHTLSTGTWYYVTMTYSSAAGLVGYVNAASDGTAAANGALNTTSVAIALADISVLTGSGWNGKMDEARIASVVRSADWITSEFNNQNAPGTFETLGTEVSLGTTANGWFYFFP